MNQQPDAAMNGLERFGQALMKIGAWPGKISSWLIIPIILAVLAAVLGGVFRLSELVTWGPSVPLFGKHLTIIGLTELQWHLFAVLVMLGAAYALEQDRHVRVDMVHEKLSPRGKAIVDALGDLILLLPFCAIVAWLSLRFVDLSFRSGEQSDYGGLTHRYLIKAFIPIGLSFLFLTGLGRVLRNVGFLMRKSSSSS